MLAGNLFQIFGPTDLTLVFQYDYEAGRQQHGGSTTTRRALIIYLPCSLSF